jgi:DNA gyrase/topoisomerase IV subunit A
VEQDLEETTICFVTEKGLVLNAKKDKIPMRKRVSGGVIGISMNKGDNLKFVAQIDDEGEILTITDHGFYKRVFTYKLDPLAVNRKGVKIVELGKDAKLIHAAHVKNPYDFAVIDTFGVAFTVNTEDCPTEDRTTKGKTLKNENKKRQPDKVFKIYEL